ncbi:MAG: hypothetical protein U0167_05245 [bacterium]
MAAKPDRKELRTFGLSLAGVCLIWAAIFWWRGRTGPVPWFLGASPVLVLLALGAPAALRPIHWFWMPVSRGVARGLTWLLLTIVFFVVFTPYGVIMRALGKDPLERKIDRARSSYWIVRHDGPFDPSRLERQY